jgi:acyl carrier protein
MTELKLLNELKIKVVQALNLMDVSPDEIDLDEQLVGGRLAIDSIDVLELVIMIEREYQLTIDSKELGAQVFTSLRSMAEFIQNRTTEATN